uniref:Glutathione S-transferase kappa 1 n=1 Tax=Scleropages formosus TaxID=113540 RepID=A0A8C9VS86_SCLFO
MSNIHLLSVHMLKLYSATSFYFLAVRSSVGTNMCGTWSFVFAPLFWEESCRAQVLSPAGHIKVQPREQDRNNTATSHFTFPRSPFCCINAFSLSKGNKPPALVPNKFAYMSKDLSRLREYFAVPLSFPADPFEVMFKKGSLAAMRYVTAVAESGGASEADVEKVSRELWMRIWSRNEDITLATSLSEAGLKAGLPASEVEECLQLASSQKIKDKLKSATQEALDLGAFGFPLSVCHIDGKKEVFFGADRFELMAHCLGDYMGIS